ncbi:hypothetical protein [Pseudothauera hydrothermalis]|uniref:hypothetical protein n=1 Tax=Pseudothauera hydrothermalis TaxID=2184083 RepID=UPI000E094DA1|nr:hypothetical protein [Pseudothauera hydrothermalis]
MSNRQGPFPWRVFLRRRFPAHAEGWVYAQVPLWWAALFADAPPTAEVDALYAVVAFVVAVAIVGALVGLASLLRFPWWLLLPFCLLSLWLDGLWRKLGKSPWQREPVRRPWYLSNAVAVWQGWDRFIRRRPWYRRLQRKLDALAPTTQPRRRKCQIVSSRAQPGPTAFDYACEQEGSHLWFWYGVGFVVLWVELTAVDAAGWFWGFVFAVLMYGLLPLTTLPFIAAAILGFLSAWLVGLGMSPQQREQARLRRAASLAAPPPPPRAHAPHTSHSAPICTELAAAADRWVVDRLCLG